MDEAEREEVFLTNAALGTDLLTSYVAAADDEPDPPRKPAGCLVALLVVLGVLVMAVAAMLAL
jgi:hypothetical protein